MAPDADHPTRTLTRSLTRTLWGDLCLDAVACEGSGLIRAKGDAVKGGAHFKSRAPGCTYKQLFRISVHKKADKSRRIVPALGIPDMVFNSSTRHGFSCS